MTSSMTKIDVMNLGGAVEEIFAETKEEDNANFRWQGDGVSDFVTRSGVVQWKAEEWVSG